MSDGIDNLTQSDVAIADSFSKSEIEQIDVITFATQDHAITAWDFNVNFTNNDFNTSTLNLDL